MRLLAGLLLAPLRWLGGCLFWLVVVAVVAVYLVIPNLRGGM